MKDADRILYFGSSLLAASVVADSAAEHFRAGAYNPMMLAGPAFAAATLAASGRAAIRASRGDVAGRALYSAAMAGGLIGFGFHVRNVLRREGGVSFANLFHGAPIGAPLGLTFAGIFGYAAEIRSDRPPAVLLGLAAAAGLAGTAAEAGLLHFRGAFHNPLMYAPVVLPPAAGALLVSALARPSRGRVRRARMALQATAALGLLGVAAHAAGTARRMGGWRNWTQNIFAGPPLPAPPSFTGMALAGLAALAGLEKGNA